MASSSSIPKSNMQDTVQGTSSQEIAQGTCTQEAHAYEIKGRTMSLEEWDLTVQVESPVDFTSLSYHDYNIKEYYESHDLMDYFNMLNGPTCMSLVRHFWVRAHVYDKKAAQQEMDEKVLIDPTLTGKTREEMGLEPLISTEIRSSVMGIPVYISQDAIAYVIRRASKGSFRDGLDNNKKSPWNEIVNQTMFNSNKKGAYSDLSMEKRMLLKIQNENLLPKGGGSDQPSLEHRMFLHYFTKKEKENVPKYIFKHKIKTLRESQLSNRTWIPYGRFISEILHQVGILRALSDTMVFTDKHLGTVTGKVINGSTLRHMKLIRKEDYKKLDTYLKESTAISNLMEDFPPICKQYPLDVQLYFIHDHLQATGETIQLEDIPEQMYGGALPTAKGKKSKKRALTEVEYLDDASEEPPKKSQKAKVAEAIGSALSTIQGKVQDLEPVKALHKRTRSGKEAEPSPPQPAQPSIPIRKRKPLLRKLKLAPEEEDEEVT